MTTTIIGRLTADPDLKFTNNGKAVVNFSVAVSRKRGEEEYTSFFDCTAWGTLAENIAESLKKGDRVIVNGNLHQDRWDKDGKKGSKVLITAENVGPDLRFNQVKVAESVSKKSEPDF